MLRIQPGILERDPRGAQAVVEVLSLAVIFVYSTGSVAPILSLSSFSLFSVLMLPTPYQYGVYLSG